MSKSFAHEIFPLFYSLKIILSEDYFSEKQPEATTTAMPFYCPNTGL